MMADAALHPGLVFCGGLAVILVGAEIVLRGATRLAASLGVPPLLIGLTVVAIGTSAPELAVGIAAAYEGRGALAVANIAGTNMVNILLILGLSAAIRPLPLHLSSIRLDVPVMVASAIALLLMAWDGVLSQVDGLVLVLAAVAYIVVLVRISRRESREVRREFAAEYGMAPPLRRRPAAVRARFGALLVAGIALTVFGADLLVVGAVELARTWGVSETIIGLTIVAIGTSTPELATTIVATFHGTRDVAVGNLIGSSITNILVILGITCIVIPGGIDVSREILWIDLPLAAAVAVACYPVFRSDHMVSRREGIVLVGCYAAYLALLVFVRT